MPYANNNGVKIYYEVDGEGPPLVMHMEVWAILGIGVNMDMSTLWLMISN